MRVSVVVPCRNESRHIRACLESIFATTFPHDQLEVLVADGASDDGTRDILNEFVGRETGPQLRVLDNLRRITPCGLNTAISAARGELIVRMDAHAVYPPEYIPTLVNALEETGVAIVGARIETVPADSSAVARAIAAGMSHPFGVGPSRFRIGTSERMLVDHLPFFCCRRELFRQVGMFDEDLVRNQDGEFSSRVRRAGGEVMLIPAAVAKYFARDSIGRLGRTLFQYGYFKPLTARKIGRVMTARQLVPPLFVLALVLLAALQFFWPPAGALLAGCVLLYAVAVFSFSVMSLRKLPLNAAALMPVVFPVMHVCYGYGYLRRLVEFALRPSGSTMDPVSVPLSR